MSRIDAFKRAIGLKANFRRSSGQTSNIMFGTIVGVITGNYIFAEPMKQYWEEERQLQQEMKQQQLAQQPKNE